MNAVWGVVGLVLLLLPMVLAYIFVEWRLVTAFLSTAILFPFIGVFLIDLCIAFFTAEEFNWENSKFSAFMLAIGSIYVYMILVLPAFLYLRTLPVAVHWSLPVMVTVIVFGVFFLLKNSEPADAVTIAVITICSFLHSWMILGIYSLLKKI